jgi:subtilisin family serine protease
MKKLIAILALALVSTSLYAGEGVLPVCELVEEEPMPADKLDLHDDDPEYLPIPDHYIVLLFPEADVDSTAAAVGAVPDEVYHLSPEGEGVSGFAATLDPIQVSMLQFMPEVELVELDGEVSIDEVQQSNAPWGLDRVDQRHLSLSNDYWYHLDANVSPTTSGPSTHTYVIDTGINYTHTEFTGRLSAAPGQFYDAFGGGGADCHGHGTHVAGTAGGTTYGVAKDTTLHSVRVLNCNGSGSFSKVVGGVNWVTANHVKPAVANMSLGGPNNRSLNRAVNRSVKAGVFYAVAAGNSNRNACNFSPATAVQAFTVAASNSNDSRASFSNFGRCVNIFAPGVNITSAWIGGNNSTFVASGTSMASPHVAGAAALHLSIYPWASPSQVAAALVGSGTAGVIQNPGNNSPNLLLHSKAGSLRTTYSGAVAGAASAFEPMGVPIFSAVSGAHEGRVTSSGGATLTLRLRQFQPGLGTWPVVATATGAVAHVIFHGGPGTYSWEVANPAGPGSPPVSYAFSMSQP